jgi:hypothetical protein
LDRRPGPGLLPALPLQPDEGGAPVQLFLLLRSPRGPAPGGGKGALDLEKRKKAYRAIHAILHEDLPYTFLYVPKLLPAINKRFKGYAPLDPWEPRLHVVRDWYVPAGLQKALQ